MNKRRKDKNKQIVCIILFIFVLLSGVFYAVYTTIGKELLANENTNSSTNVIKTETDDKTTVSNEEEPNIEDDKPLTNKTTTENKNNTKKPKPSKPNNTTKPNANVVFDGYEVVHEKPNTSGDNTTGDNSSSSGSNTSRPKSTVAKVSSSINLIDSNDIIKSSNVSLKGSGNSYTISGTITVGSDVSDTYFNLARIYLEVFIETPEAYLDDNILNSCTISSEKKPTAIKCEVSKAQPIQHYRLAFTTTSQSSYIDINWGKGDPQRYNFTYDIKIEREQVQPDTNETIEDNN